MDNKEPYRATKLWNEVIKAFQLGMPLKKHRRKIQTYHDCFMASDAVTWLHCYLMNNPNFGPDVTRQQTINLLGKFLKCHVIEIISCKSKKSEFLDNSHLYRFTQVSPQQLKSFPLRLVQSPVLHRKEKCNRKEIRTSFKLNNKCLPEIQKENIPECLFVERKMTLTEIGLIWKTATLARLENELSCISLSDILDEKVVSGHAIKHNVCRISRTGVVSLIDKTDDIPHWVISAMKCLANWPNASGSGSCLPNYPGFEKDVFKVVRDFFINPQVPLIPAYLSSVMLTVFCHFLQDQIKFFYDSKHSFKNEESALSSKNFSMQSTDVKTSTPLVNTAGERLSSRDVPLLENSDGILLLDDPEVMWDYPSAIYFETDFATSDPVTKMVPIQSHSRTASYGSLHRSMESISTISVCSMNPESNCVNNILVPTTPLKNWNSDPCLQDEKQNQVASQSLQLQTNTLSKRRVRQSHSMFDYLHLPYFDGEDPLNTSTCSSKTITEESERMSLQDFSGVKQIFVSPVDNQKFSSAILCESKSSLLQSSHVSVNTSGRNDLKQFEDINFPPELKSSFQLLLLFLHPPNRRQVHLLFRVINKIIKNNKFILDVRMPVRDYLLQTFLPAIVQSDVNQNLLFGMVLFLLDNCEALFQPPCSLKEEVEELCKLRNGKIVYSVDDACYLTYCELVSKQQYEEQKVSTSAEALKSLLNSIILDKKLSERERKRRMKQFKESHPEVYYEMFPGKQNMVRSKSTLLNRLANLRM